MWRPRVEVFALSEDGKRVFGGVWDEDGSFALPGGGVDEGESHADAAYREFVEETGFEIRDPVSLRAMALSRWSDAYRATLPEEKQRYVGSMIHFMKATIIEPLRKVQERLEPWAAHGRRMYDIREAIEIMHRLAPERYKERHRMRLAALERARKRAL
jgi:8-oxo-dGTP pyrophosphatase MutT (NUDIX family)